jgi:uncharacterized lipoprotein YddW (UPF0748 family)
MRGIWVARWSLSSPQAIRNIVANAKRHHFNTLFVQVRGRGDAWYKSDLEPRARELAKADPAFDPLALMVEEAHKNDIEVHAWLDTYLVWTGNQPPASPLHVVNAHPDWLARDRSNHGTSRPSGNMEGLFLQASNPQVQEHLYRVFLDVATRYDVDGIHFDYVRYPNADYDFSDATLARFRAYMEPSLTDTTRAALQHDPSRLAYVHVFPSQWAEWRRTQVSALVSRVADTIHQEKPWVQVSAAVFANQTDAYQEKGQDWRRWLAEDWLDAVCPMAYSTDTKVMERQIRQAIAAANGKYVYAGIGSYRISANSTADKIDRVRALGAQGINLFDYESMTHNGQRTQYLDRLTRESFPSRAGVPRMGWRGRRSSESGEPSRGGQPDR